MIKILCRGVCKLGQFQVCMYFSLSSAHLVEESILVGRDVESTGFIIQQFSDKLLR